MASAVATVDVLYGTLGLAGAGQLTHGAGVSLVLGLLSAGILVAIGARAVWAGFRARAGLERQTMSLNRGGRLSPLLRRLRSIRSRSLCGPSRSPPPRRALRPDRPATPSRFSRVWPAGTLAWYCGFSTAVAVARRRVGPKLLAAVDIGTGSGLIAFGAVLGYRSVHEH